MFGCRGNTLRLTIQLEFRNNIRRGGNHYTEKSATEKRAIFETLQKRAIDFVRCVNVEEREPL